MGAKIKCYKGNADLFVDGNFFPILWDGMTFDNKEEWSEWADEVLSPAADCNNYMDIRLSLHIHTMHLIND